MKKRLIILFASALFLGGCAVEGVETVPDETVVAQGEPPYAGAVWIGTEYSWSGGRYIATPAHWEHGRTGATYHAGHWDHGRKGYRWTHGGWH